MKSKRRINPMCLVLAILLGNTVFANQSPATLQKVLGKEKVRSILSKVLTRKIESFSNSYVITEEAFDKAKSVGIPDVTLNKLESMKGQEIQGGEKFQAALTQAIGKEDTQKYESVIASNARGYLIVEEKFLQFVEALVLNTEAPDKGDTEEWLEQGFDRFLTDYILFSKKKSKNRVILVTDTGNNDISQFERFLMSQSAKCGEIPCSIPPCCGKKCNHCKK